MDELDDFRQIVREELRRESIGARCPECWETDQGLTLEQIEHRTDEEETHFWTCWACEFAGPVERYDPLNQSEEESRNTMKPLPDEMEDVDLELL